MTESEITKRFKEVNALLWNAWKDPTLFKLIGELAESFEYLEDGQLPVVHDEVRELLGACARNITDALDEVLKEVPPTPYAKLRAVELLSGNAVPWGIKLDLAFIKIRLSRELITVFERDEEDIIREVDEVAYYYGLEAGKKLLERRKEENTNRLIAIRRDFDFELTRILHHFNAAINKWGAQEHREVPAAQSSSASSLAKPGQLAPEPKAWPDLKSLALFHAYRVEAGEDSADINPSNAQRVAHDAGHKAPSSGRTLLESYRNYATGNPEKRKRERTKEGKRPGDVAKRFTVVLDRLSRFPDALTIARAEHRIVRTRSNGSED